MEELTRAELLRRRQVSQGLAARTPPTGPASRSAAAVEAADRLFALQGQDFPGALFSLGLRSGATLPEVTAAFNTGTLVRSWPFRGTLHVLRATDLHWILGLTSERMLRSAARRREELGLDEAVFSAARSAAVQALAGGKALGRRELLTRFQAAGVDTSGQRGYHLLWHLGVEGTLVLGPVQGTEQLFVLLDEWVPRPRALTGTAALAELARRYLAGRSPATEADLAWWSKLPLASIRAGLAAAARDLQEVGCDGVTHYQLCDPEDGGGRPVSRTQPAALLPGFDEYLLGYANRNAALAPDHAALTVPGGNGVFKPTLVLRGRIAGLWSRKTSAKKTVVRIHPFAPLPVRNRAGISRAAEAYGRFLGTAVEVEYP